MNVNNRDMGGASDIELIFYFSLLSKNVYSYMLRPLYHIINPIASQIIENSFVSLLYFSLIPKCWEIYIQ